MNQQEIDNKRASIVQSIEKHRNCIWDLEDELKILNNKEAELDDPHALIPKIYKTMDKWIDGHPYPENCLQMFFKNRREAENVQRSSNTYSFDYHVVKY